MLDPPEAVPDGGGQLVDSLGDGNGIKAASVPRDTNDVFYVAVPSVEAALQKAARLGGKRLMGSERKVANSRSATSPTLRATCCWSPCLTAQGEHGGRGRADRRADHCHRLWWVEENRSVAMATLPGKDGWPALLSAIASCQVD